MLPKEYRLRKKKDFEAIFKSGRYLRGNFLALKTLKNGLPLSRFGIVVSAKVSKKAVVRNKIRRRLRAIIRRLLPEIKAGFDLAVIVSPATTEKTFAETEQELNFLLKKGNFLNAK